MTVKVFWENPYQTSLNTRVTGVDGNVITVAETIFYALSGGQESDYGVFNEQVVLKAEKKDLEIFYTLPDNHGFMLGSPVTMTIDWPRRYQLMRLHFAAEMVLELIQRACPSIKKTGAHISATKARIDFLSSFNLKDTLADITSEVQHLVDLDLSIRSYFTDQLKERRAWAIDGFSMAACGGTHIKKTGEVGRVRLKRVNQGSAKERVEIYVE